MTERLLIGFRTDPGQDTEAEPVLVHLDGSWAVLSLDDGTTVTVDRLELISALREPLREAA